MKNILFVCHGNICRSPMAEFIAKDIIAKRGLEDEFYISSAATSTEEIGNDIYFLAKEKLLQKGVKFSKREARRVRKEDYEKYDFILLMDERNRANIRHIIPHDKEGKIRLLLEYTNNPRQISDPWYSGDFEKTYHEIIEGIEAFLDKI